ncbi:MAG: zinc-ribbon domain-containing protein [Thermodesulfobacteriota bacterium]|nr:zinc-ribbon domain-containing protein [Thermodesulfobacteriota bacterium]
MRLSCPNCQKELNIPDDKLPDVNRFVLTCPSCRDKMTVDRDGDKVSASPVGRPIPAPEAPPEAPAEPQLPVVEPEVFPPGSKVVFLSLHDPAWKGAVESFFKDKGYNLSSSDDVLEAVAKLRLNHYDVFVTEDSDACAPLMSEVNSWPGFRRRDLNCILVGEESASLQPQAAFEKGVNFYLNKSDASRAGELFADVCRGFDLYYRMFALAAEQRDE